MAKATKRAKTPVKAKNAKPIGKAAKKSVAATDLPPKTSAKAGGGRRIPNIRALASGVGGGTTISIPISSLKRKR